MLLFVGFVSLLFLLLCFVMELCLCYFLCWSCALFTILLELCLCYLLSWSWHLFVASVDTYVLCLVILCCGKAGPVPLLLTMSILLATAFLKECLPAVF